MIASRAGHKPALSLFRRAILALACAVSLFFFSSEASAHRPGESYLRLMFTTNGIIGELDLSLRDLETTIGLDVDGNGSVTYEELLSRQAAIAEYTLPKLKVRADGREGKLRPTTHLVATHSDGVYAVVGFEVDGLKEPGEVEIETRLFFDVNPQHQTLLQVVQGKAEHVGALTLAAPVGHFKLDAPSRSRTFQHFLNEGLRHIGTGFDHILFLLALLLPAVLERVEKAWRAVESFRPAFWDAFKVVTAFTIAHAITLTFASLGWVTLPARPVETAIAASVVFAACNNLRPIVKGRPWVLAFGFGFIHGFGYASVLADLGLKGKTLALALVSFNVGVELGQLAIVIGILPVAYALRESKLYQQGIFKFGSIAVALVALVWMVQRAFDVPLLPF